ncbi:MAG: hypothetical protein JXQ30_09375 [Spirochaetes bacterium]|nr:hypothetical protein [Spirochaetota bacterium]
MEIEKTARSTNHTGAQKTSPKPGDLIRVRVIRHVRGSSYLVEIKGETRTARLEGRIPSPLFIARVLKLKPRMILQHVKTFKETGNAASSSVYRELLGREKSFIQKLIATDNFLEKLVVTVRHKKELIRESLRDAVRNQNIYRMLEKSGIVSKEVITYYCLQQMHNLLNYSALTLLFSLRIKDRSCPCDLAVSRAEDGSEYSFLLTISFENGRKIAFLVFTDYKAIHCTISTNSKELETQMKADVEKLVGGLKRLRFERDVTVRFSPYEDAGFYTQDNLKKIDIRL